MFKQKSYFKLAMKLLLSLITTYLFVCLFMWAVQRYLIYKPTVGIQAPTAYGLYGFTDIALKSMNDVEVHVWYCPANDGYPTLIYFHGNGGNLAHYVEHFQALHYVGFGILALDYRGYGASKGTPSEDDIYHDARTVMHYAIQELSLSTAQIIIYGESLGTAVAAQMATEYSIAALVLQAPFTSVEALAADIYPWLPVSILLQDRFDSLSKIESINTPVLILHGERDTTVPIKYGRMLFDKAPTPKEFIYYPENGHAFAPKPVTDVLMAFSRKHIITTKY